MSRPHRTYHEQLDDVREQLRHGRGPTPRAQHAGAGGRSPKGGPGQTAASAADAVARTIHSLEQAATETRRVHADGAAQRTQRTHDTFAQGYRQAKTQEERRDAADRIERNDQQHRESENRHRARQDWIDFGKFAIVVSGFVVLGLAAIKAGRVTHVA
ncbi:hypothetical protein RKE25_22865 (plasmid) [Dyella sp. BiH032]|uniref:hypothetical protein n=1 Tax=Dyella sp. BiH032 TaxID=3075430 RepID=UPI00289336AE|nr:hypothetical protein [Dyella sp. BiH032]WNL48378.1 hypothetical protein RKE25_22865 [Dyella sp. BiH032]